MNIFHRKSLLAACIAAMMGLHGYAQKNEASCFSEERSLLPPPRKQNVDKTRKRTKNKNKRSKQQKFILS